MSFSHICILWSETGPKRWHSFCWKQNKVFSLFSKLHILLFCFTLPCDSSARPQKKERDNTSTSCLSKRLDWYPYCLMRTGQRESKFVFKIPHTTPLLTGDFSKVTCARSLRHKGLRFIFCDLPVGDKMIFTGENHHSGGRKGKTKDSSSFCSQAVLSFQAFQFLV